MKKIYLIISFIFISTLFYAQPADSSKAVPNDQGEKQQEKFNEDNKEFVDMDGDGIDDRLEERKMGNKGKGKQMRNDRFIDEDGDGICDGRESGIGLKKTYRNRRGKSHGN